MIASLCVVRLRRRLAIVEDTPRLEPESTYQGCAKAVTALILLDWTPRMDAQCGLYWFCVLELQRTCGVKASDWGLNVSSVPERSL